MMRIPSPVRRTRAGADCAATTSTNSVTLARWRARRLPARLLALACSIGAAGALAATPPTTPAATTATGARLPTVVSTNLCADQALLGLAAPEQILSVSSKSQDPEQSLLAEQARRYPANRASAEEILHWRPDIVLASRSWAGSRQGKLLAAHGIRIVTLPNPQNLPAIFAATQQLADQLGRAEQGRALLLDLQRRLDTLQRDRQPLRVVYLRSNGGSAGRDTFVDAVFDMLGLINQPARAGIAGWGRYPLERLVLDPPDVFVLGYFERQRPLSKTLYAQQPVLLELLAQRPHIEAPTQYWGCGGWQLVDAAENIAAQLAALRNGNAAATTGAVL